MFRLIVSALLVFQFTSVPTARASDWPAMWFLFAVKAAPACVYLLSAAPFLKKKKQLVGFNALRRMVQDRNGDSPELNEEWEEVRRVLAIQEKPQGQFYVPFRHDFFSKEGLPLSLQADLVIDFAGWREAKYDGVSVKERAVASVHYQNARFLVRDP